MRRAVLVGGMAAVVALAAVVVWLSRSDEGSARVAVPRVNGLDVLSAQRRLAGVGLRIALEDPSGAAVPGSPVASQRPAARAQVQRGTAVSVTLREQAQRRTAAWDDFDDRARSWFEENSAKNGAMRLVDGRLVITLDDPLASWWEIDDFDPAQRDRRDVLRTHSNLPPTGGRIDVDVRRVSGSWRVTYGLVCAAQDGRPSYQLLVDGRFGFIILSSDRAEPLRAWDTDVFGINRSRNHLAAECRPAGPGRGVALTFWVNSTRVAHVHDQDGVSPSFFGVYVGAAGRNPVEIRFDNFVFQPLEKRGVTRSWWVLQPVTP